MGESIQEIADRFDEQVRPLREQIEAMRAQLEPLIGRLREVDQEMERDRSEDWRTRASDWGRGHVPFAPTPRVRINRYPLQIVED